MLDDLFPVPSLPPTKLLPGQSPGVSPHSTETLQTVLKDNHVKWHIFFNEKRFHNHAPHRSIAAWALGADADTIRKSYDKDCHDYEKPAIRSPEPITTDNFKDHFGDDKYFGAYVQFFTKYLKDKGINNALEEFIFSRTANLGTSGTDPVERQPQMLTRFLTGAIHPLIHTGYGVEFTLPGMVAEGLAEMAVHHSTPGLLEPLLLFGEDSVVEKMSTISLVGSNVKEDPHALTILARVLRDPKLKLDPEDRGEESLYISVIKKCSKGVAAYVNVWDIDPERLDDIGWEKKVEEIVWTVVVLYGVGGWTHGKDKGGFIADFFLMHLVTSSIFLPSLCAVICPISRSRLLKTYLAVVCIWAIAQGPPTLDVKGFVKEMEDSAKATPVDTASNVDGNLWDKLLGEARVHPDEHLTKIIRSLAAWARAFGTRNARMPLPTRASGTVHDEECNDIGNCLPPTELPGSEYLDGGLFSRVAVLTYKRMGWDFGNEKIVRQIPQKEETDWELPEFWDFDGFFEEGHPPS